MKKNISILGGIITIIIRCLLFGYFLSNLIDVVNRAQSQVVNSIYKKDLSFDSTEIVLNVGNFDMGIFVSYFGTKDGVQENIDTYFTTNVFQVYFEDNPYTWGTGNDWQMTSMDLEICKEGRFLGENKTTQLTNITGNYICPKKDFEIKLSGTTSSKSANLIYVTVDYCDQAVLDYRNPGKKLKCKPQKEADEILAYMNIFFAFITQYFDHNNYSDNPIVNNIQLNYWPLNKYISNNQMMKYTRNQVTTKDSWLTASLFSNDYTYYTGRLEYTQIGTRDLAATWSLFSVEIDMDEGFVLTERSVMTILDAFSIVGGMMGITFTFTQYFIEKIQENMFIASIIGKIFYQVDSDQTNLSPFKYSFRDLVAYKARRCILKMLCKSITKQNLKLKYKLYKKAKSQIEREFDVVRMMKTMRRVDLIFKTLFSKSQAFFIPILKDNVLEESDLNVIETDQYKKEIDRIRNIQNDQLKIYISQLILSKDTSKLDKRILKHLSDEYQAQTSKAKNKIETVAENALANKFRKNILQNIQQHTIDTNVVAESKTEMAIATKDFKRKQNLNGPTHNPFFDLKQKLSLQPSIRYSDNNCNDTTVIAMSGQSSVKNMISSQENSESIQNLKQGNARKGSKKFDFQDVDYQNDWRL
eukprot:403361367